MSLNTAASSLITLSRMSAEEASRFGRPAIDIEHIFLALTLTDTPAGQLLRAHGATYTASLAAIRSIESAALESLGVTPPATLLPAKPSATHGLTERASRIFNSARNVKSDYFAILEALISEPSGTIAAILDYVGTNPLEIRAGMPNEGALILPDKDSANESLSNQALIAQATTSCPAPIEAVTDFLNDPKNIPVWESSVRERTLTSDTENQGQTWIATPITEGKGALQDCSFRITREESKDDGICWRFEAIDIQSANIMHVNFALIPEGASTTVLTTLRFTPLQARPLWRRLLGKFTSHIAARMRAENIAGAVNLNFRP